ncbi:Tad domain-containing protein [Bradyrhizobium sp. JR3.5]
MIFTFAMLPILAFVGAAVDYTRANNARTAMQSALDSTALMLSKDLTMGTITAAQIPSKAQTYFNSLFTNKDGQGIATEYLGHLYDPDLERCRDHSPERVRLHQHLFHEVCRSVRRQFPENEFRYLDHHHLGQRQDARRPRPR